MKTEKYTYEAMKEIKELITEKYPDLYVFIFRKEAKLIDLIEEIKECPRLK